MNKRLLTLIFTVGLFSSTFSQKSYPIYQTDSLGHKVVVMTVMQAQILENRSEMLDLFEKINMSSKSYDSLCERTIRLKDVVILKQKMDILSISKLVNNKDKQISMLNRQIELNVEDLKILEKQISIKDDIIKEKDHQILGLKLKSLGVSGVCILVGFLFGTIYGK